MKKMLVVFATMVSVAFVPTSYAATAKEGIASVTLRYMRFELAPVNTVKKAGGAQTFEEVGVMLSDSGKGPFNKISTRDVGIWKYERKGPKNTKTVQYSVWADTDGDQLYLEGKFQPEGKVKKVVDIIGGTGKFANMDITITPVLPSTQLISLKEGHTFGVHKYRIGWKLP